MQNNRIMSTKAMVRLLSLALCLVLISCVGASLLQTDLGKVQVMTFRLPTDGGKWVTANLFRPKSATAENPVPLVVTSHGGANNKEMQDITAIELSRRGIAVIALDRYFHGDSSAAEVTMAETMLTPTMAMLPLVEYAWTLDYVDRSRIGVTGHSLGGGSAWYTMQHYGKQYYEALALATSPQSEGGETITPTEQERMDAADKIAAGLPMGSAVLFCNEATLSQIHANLGVIEGQFDENGYLRPQGVSKYLERDADVLALFNSAQPKGKMLQSAELESYYGSAADKSLRVLYNPFEIHPWNHFSSRSAAATSEFFTRAFQMENPIPSNNQTWLLKEIFNFVGLIGAMMFILPFALLLLKIPCFASLVGQEPPLLPARTSAKAKCVFWGSWCLTALVSWLSFVPVGRLDFLFGATQSKDNSSVVFPQPTTNFILAWAIFNGLIGLLLFYLCYRFYGKSNGVSPQMWGIRITTRELVKTMLLAVCIFAGFYTLVFLADYFFQTDFRLWILAAKPFAADKLMMGLRYMLLFFVFYLSHAISVNSVNRIEGQKEWVGLAICGLGNVLGIAIIVGLQYGTLFLTGACLYRDELTFRPLFIITLIPLLLFATWLSRQLFKVTGKVWLGAIVNCSLIVMMGVANTLTRTTLPG